jgi:hypothetical protein
MRYTFKHTPTGKFLYDEGVWDEDNDNPISLLIDKQDKRIESYPGSFGNKEVAKEVFDYLKPIIHTNDGTCFSKTEFQIVEV